MDVESKIKMILRPPFEEILTEDLLRKRLESGEELRHYIGFEISGLIHIGTGVYSTIKIADFQKAGIKTKVFLADWHTYINDKLGGNLELIREVAKEYYVPTFRAMIERFGGDPDKTKFILASEVYTEEYWELVIRVAKQVTLSRVVRSVTVAGRKEGETLDFAKYVYPIMQVADIFYLNVNFAHAGIDQRKVHVIAIDIAEKLGFEKPIAYHHNLIPAINISPELWKLLKEGKKEELRRRIAEIKMSKSKPFTAIFLHDSPEEIRRKIRKSFCPQGEVEHVPILVLLRDVFFRGGETKKPLVIENEKTGETLEYYSWRDFVVDWKSKRIHPLDLKNAVANWLIDLLEPARKIAEKKREVIEKITVTR